MRVIVILRDALEGAVPVPVSFESKFDENTGKWSDPDLTAEIFIEAARQRGFEADFPEKELTC